MFYDFLIGTAELLFWLTGGTALMNTLWIIPWVLGTSVLMIVPLFYPIWFNKPHLLKYSSLLFLVCFFPILLTTIGPPIKQMQMLADCRSVEVPVETEKASKIFEMEECRYKENYYGDYGEWKLSVKNH